MEALKVAIAGLGVVGGGTAQALTRNADVIERRAGRAIKLVKLADKNLDAARAVCPAGCEVTDDALSIARDPGVDVVVELIGGTGFAKTLIMEAIANGKNVVTANKKLLAENGNEIFAAAEAQGTQVRYEAAVAGSIPIIKILRESATANRIDFVAGVINGTSNYILTEMAREGKSFSEALSDAQRLGYAEADPTFDVEGVDAAHKLTIMASLAFGMPLKFSKCHIEGVSGLDSKDVRYANELGYKVKLLGIARRDGNGVQLRVHPTLLPENRLLASVDGVMNAVWTHGDLTGSSLLYGAGAGSLPTAGAVAADVIDLARAPQSCKNSLSAPPHLAFRPDAIEDLPIVPMSEVVCGYYLRIVADDQSGVLAKITEILAQQNISIEALLQKSVLNSPLAEIVILTHTTRERNAQAAIKAIEGLERVRDKVYYIRTESFHFDN